MKRTKIHHFLMPDSWENYNINFPFGGQKEGMIDMANNRKVLQLSSKHRSGIVLSISKQGLL